MLSELKALQAFRETEGLHAPRSGHCSSYYGAHSMGLRSIAATLTAGHEPRTPDTMKGTTQPDSFQMCDTPFHLDLIPVEEASYVVDTRLQIRRVSEVINPCGAWGVGGTPRVGSSLQSVACTNTTRLSAATRLCKRFQLGRPRSSGESLALVDHLWSSRSTAGGCGPAGGPWRINDAECGNGGSWEAADKAIRLAHEAMCHQWRMGVEPPAPTRPKMWAP